MRILFFFSMAVFIATFCQAQQAITPEISKKINASIEKQVPAIRAKLRKADPEMSEEALNFDMDTFRMEEFCRKCMDQDGSTAGMNEAMDKLAKGYDSLMNKYYKLLKAKLQPDDQKTLVTAQKTWLDYRDKELKLISTLRDPKYSGGGSIQSNLYMGEYVAIIKSRTIEIFEFYDDMVESDSDGE